MPTSLNGWWLASARTGYLDVVLSYIDSTSGLDPSWAMRRERLGRVATTRLRDVPIVQAWMDQLTEYLQSDGARPLVPEGDAEAPSPGGEDNAYVVRA